MEAARRKPWFKAGPTTSPITLTLLRIGVGTIMAAHGWSKLMDVPSWRDNVAGMGIPVPEVAAWLAIAGELGGGVGLVLGLLTPLAAFGILCVMLTAIVYVHLGNGLFAANNGFEYPMTIGLVATYFLVRGAGPLSVDAFIESRQRQRPATAPASRAPTSAVVP